MNIDAEFQLLLLNYGYDVLLIRRNKERKCDCNQNATREIDRNCPKCFGLGYHFIAERHTSRSEDISVPETLPRLTQHTKMGDLNSQSRDYYFLPSVVIEEGDLIIDYLSNGTEVSIKDSNIYVVNHIDRTARINGPTPVYFRVFCGAAPLQRDKRIQFLSQIKTIQNYSLTYVDSKPVAETTPIPVDSISIQQNGVPISIIGGPIGTTFPLTAVIEPTNATDKKVTWSSVNPSIFLVDQNGVVTITGIGTALLGVSSSDGQIVSFAYVKGQ
jgi:hypothetical protein